MQIEISPEAEAVIASLVSSGAYADAAEVVEEAVRQLQAPDEKYLARLTEMLDEGIASLDAHGGTPWTPDLADRIRAEARALHEAHLQTSHP